MLAIRLRRMGARRDPHYRVVVTDRSNSRDGRFLEILGHYHPRRQPMEVDIDVERAEVWLQKGAKMSSTVHSLYQLVKEGGPTEKATAQAPAPPSPPAEDEGLAAAAEAEASEEGAAPVEEAAAGESDAEGSTDEASEESSDEEE